jgi:riboflavin synthase
MFTGLVECIGTITKRAPQNGGARVLVCCPLAQLVLGESIAVDGVCLTVAKLAPGGFEADASSETLERSTLGSTKLGSNVNIERALAVGDRMGGHMVSGHVDGVGTLTAMAALGNATELTFAMPHTLAHFVAEKGSIAIAGISLTVNAVGSEEFSVAVIPHTLANTSLQHARNGFRVNLEVDVVARYVARIMAVGGGQPTGASANGERAAAWDQADAHMSGVLRKAGYMT